MAPPTSGHVRGALATSTTAVVALVGGWTWAAREQPDGYDAVRESISALAASETPHRWIMTVALILTGLAHVGSAVLLQGMRRTGRLVLGAAGLATLAVALVPLPSRSDGSAVHTVVASLSFALLAVWPWFAAHPDATPLLRPP